MKFSTFLSCIILAFSLAACAKPVTYRPNVDARELEAEELTQSASVQQDKLEKMERKGKKRLKQQSQLQEVFMPVARAGLSVCQGLKLGEDNNQCVYTAILDEDGPVNAYANGEEIHVTPAMMRFVDTDDELAFVLSHELAHNLMNHIGAQRRNALLGALVGLMADGVAAYNGVQTNGAFTSGAAGVGMLAYSKDFEQEADYVGLYILSLAGYDIHYAPEMWRRMSLREPDAIYTATTHPSNPERFVFMQQTIREIDAKKSRRETLLPEIHKDSAESPAGTPAPVRIRR